MKEEFIVTLGIGISLYAIFALAVKTGLSASSLSPYGAAFLIGGGSLISVAGYVWTWRAWKLESHLMLLL